MSQPLDDRIRSICRKEGLVARQIQPLTGGQVNRAYLVDGEVVLRAGLRERASQRLKAEFELVQKLAGVIPTARMIACGELDGLVYQLQAYVPGQKLHTIWNVLPPDVQEGIVVQLASYIKALHQLSFPDFGYLHDQAHKSGSWSTYLTGRLKETVKEIYALNIRMASGYVDLVLEAFEEHKHVLDDGAPTLVHKDLWLGNILVDQGKITAILDFEYAIQAPRDYEIQKIEDFCLYPNDYAEEEDEIYCSTDFGGFFRLLRKHYSELFETTSMRQRMDLYHLESSLCDYLAWRKDNLTTIPPDQPAAKEFYMARVTNFTFRHGARMFQ